MRTKEFLQQYEQINNERNAVIERMLELRSQIECITNQYSLTAGVTSSNKKDLADSISKLCEIEKEHKYYVDKLNDKLIEIMRVINTAPLTAECRAVIIARYISLLSWNQIARSFNYSERQLYRIHKKSLWIIEKDVSKCQL